MAGVLYFLPHENRAGWRIISERITMDNAWLLLIGVGGFAGLLLVSHLACGFVQWIATGKWPR